MLLQLPWFKLGVYSRKHSLPFYGISFYSKVKTPFLFLFLFLSYTWTGSCRCQQVDDSVQTVGSFMDSCLQGARAHWGLLMGDLQTGKGKA